MGHVKQDIEMLCLSYCQDFLLCGCRHNPARPGLSRLRPSYVAVNLGRLGLRFGCDLRGPLALAGSLSRGLVVWLIIADARSRGLLGRQRPSFCPPPPFRMLLFFCSP